MPEEVSYLLIIRNPTHNSIHPTYNTMSLTHYFLHPPSKRYETVEEILREFYDLRLKMYEKRKAYMVSWVNTK